MNFDRRIVDRIFIIRFQVLMLRLITLPCLDNISPCVGISDIYPIYLRLIVNIQSKNNKKCSVLPFVVIALIVIFKVFFEASIWETQWP